MTLWRALGRLAKFIELPLNVFAGYFSVLYGSGSCVPKCPTMYTYSASHIPVIFMEYLVRAGHTCGRRRAGIAMRSEYGITEY